LQVLPEIVMSQPPPLPMNYQTPSPPLRGAWPLARQMLAGLGLGILMSLIVWVGGWKYLEKGNAGLNAMVAVPLIKFCAGVTFLCIRGWRGFGGGILMSLAFGLLIFFGACAANL
jgi:hypothetical protein